MKTRVIAIAGVLMTFLSCFAQEWIGSRFSLDTIIVFRSESMPQNTNQIKYGITGNKFFFVEQQGFRQKGNSYYAVIHTLSMDDYEQADIFLPLPGNNRNNERYARGLWIFDVCFEGDRVLLTTQDELILYERIQNQNYRVTSTYHHRNLFLGYLHQDKIYFFEEDHDKGFKWFQKDLDGDSATLVRELPYEAPHIVQIQPNRYIFHNQQSVFFLSTRFPRIEVYDLDGRSTDTLVFDLPQWKAFEDEYIQRTLSVPYGIERIYAVKDNINDYSYPKAVIPFHGEILLLYMQYDSLTGKSELQYALRKENGGTTRYLWNNHENSEYTAARFPFTLFHGGLDKGNAPYEDMLVQLTYKTGISWRGKKHADYFNEVNHYFAENSPVLAYKIMRLQPSDGTEKPMLFTTSGNPISLECLPSEKTVLLLHQGIECSGCVKALLGLLNHSETEGIHIGQVYPKQLMGLQAFEIRNELRQQLDKPFTLYYDTTAQYGGFSPTLTLQESDFPCLILYRKGERPTLFRSTDLFTPDYNSTEFQETFLESWHSFLHQ